MRRLVTSVLRHFKRLMLSVCVAAWLTALVFTHIPGEEMPGVDVSDKLLHLVGFFGLGSLFWLTLAAYGIRRLHRVPTVVCVMVIYAAVDETTQGLFRRSPEIGDWLADMLGSVLSVAVWEAAAYLTRKRRPRATEVTPSPPSYER
jgi:VanZ family protein